MTLLLYVACINCCRAAVKTTAVPENSLLCRFLLTYVRMKPGSSSIFQRLSFLLNCRNVIWPSNWSAHRWGVWISKFADWFSPFNCVETSYLNIDTVCASWSHFKTMKAEPIWLIPRKLAANLDLLMLIKYVTPNKFWSALQIHLRVFRNFATAYDEVHTYTYLMHTFIVLFLQGRCVELTERGHQRTHSSVLPACRQRVATAVSQPRASDPDGFWIDNLHQSQCCRYMSWVDLFEAQSAHLPYKWWVCRISLRR